jgi:MFS family permease
MSSVTPVSDSQPAPANDHRWLILVIVAVAQLMVVLDATVVNIALPSAQHALGFPNSDRQWVVTAYALAFGSLLLLGGRLGDMFSRKWVFITGLAGFALSSALGGAAQSFGMLVSAPCRACSARSWPRRPWARWSARSVTRASGAGPSVSSGRWPAAGAPWASSSAAS